MVKIAVLASFNMDLVMRTDRYPSRGETLQGDFTMFLGGKGFNQGVAARRLGADVAVAGRVGDDDFGQAFLAALDAEGIDRRAVSVDRERGTGVASIVVDGEGENAIIQAPRANRALSASDIEAGRGVFDGASVAMMQLETSLEALAAFSRLARSLGVATLINPAPARGLDVERLPQVDYVVPNELEAVAVAGAPADTTPAELAQRLRDAGAQHAVLTLGARGAVAAGPEHMVFVPAFEVDVVDSVGAGDAFCAGLAVRVAEGAALADAVRFACAAGAVACTRPGAEPSMPYRDEVEGLLAKGAVT